MTKEVSEEFERKKRKNRQKERLDYKQKQWKRKKHLRIFTSENNMIETPQNKEIVIKLIKEKLDFIGK